jgi:hypothetical protein
VGLFGLAEMKRWVGGKRDSGGVVLWRKCLEMKELQAAGVAERRWKAGPKRVQTGARAGPEGVRMRSREGPEKGLRRYSMVRWDGERSAAGGSERGAAKAIGTSPQSGALTEPPSPAGGPWGYYDGPARRFARLC